MEISAGSGDSSQITASRPVSLVALTSILLLLLAALWLAVGCAAPAPDSAVDRALDKEKSFSGTWVHRVVTRDASEDAGVVSRMKTAVDGERFHVVLYGPSARSRAMMEFYSDEKKHSMVSMEMQAAGQWEGPAAATTPFWGINADEREALKVASDDSFAGRKCFVLRRDSGGDPDGERYTVYTYWIDKESGVVLKKEHTTGPADDPAVRESYEAEEFKAGRPPASALKAPSPSDYEAFEQDPGFGELFENTF